MVATVNNYRRKFDCVTRAVTVRAARNSSDGCAREATAMKPLLINHFGALNALATRADKWQQYKSAYGCGGCGGGGHCVAECEADLGSGGCGFGRNSDSDFDCDKGARKALSSFQFAPHAYSVSGASDRPLVQLNWSAQCLLEAAQKLKLPQKHTKHVRPTRTSTLCERPPVARIVVAAGAQSRVMNSVPLDAGAQSP